MTLAQLFLGCIFRHGDLLRTRDDQGYLALECADCGKTTPLFQQPVFNCPSSRPRPSMVKESRFANHRVGEVATL